MSRSPEFNFRRIAPERDIRVGQYSQPTYHLATTVEKRRQRAPIALRLGQAVFTLALVFGVGEFCARAEHAENSAFPRTVSSGKVLPVAPRSFVTDPEPSGKSQDIPIKRRPSTDPDDTVGVTIPGIAVTAQPVCGAYYGSRQVKLNGEICNVWYRLDTEVPITTRLADGVIVETRMAGGFVQGDYLKKPDQP